MAIFNQLAGLPVVGCDLVFQNYSLTLTILSGTGVLFDTGNPGTLYTPPGVLNPTAAGGVVGSAGLAMENILPGKTGKVRIFGGFVGIANATLVPGNLVEICDVAAHLGQVILSTSTHEILGKCLSSAAAGDPVLVWINPTSHN